MVFILSFLSTKYCFKKGFHLGLNQKTQRPPPKPKSIEIQIDYSDSQLPDYEEAFPSLDVFPDYSIG
jgi:hypothetical protein